MLPEHFTEEAVIAGFGGQGVVLLGKLLAQAALRAGYEVTCMTSYGAEVRGGTANSMVVISDGPIACPLVSLPDAVIALNTASLRKFAPRLKPGGLLIVNSSLVAEPPDRDDLEVLPIPADRIALDLGSPQSANMVALGAYLQRRGRPGVETAAACLPDVLAPRHHKTIPVNRRALLDGARFVASLAQSPR